MDAAITARTLLGGVLWAVGWISTIHSDNIMVNLRRPGETGDFRSPVCCSKTTCSLAAGFSSRSPVPYTRLEYCPSLFGSRVSAASVVVGSATVFTPHVRLLSAVLPSCRATLSPRPSMPAPRLQDPKGRPLRIRFSRQLLLRDHGVDWVCIGLLELAGSSIWSGHCCQPRPQGMDPPCVVSNMGA